MLEVRVIQRAYRVYEFSGMAPTDRQLRRLSEELGAKNVLAAVDGRGVTIDDHPSDTVDQLVIDALGEVFVRVTIVRA